MYVNVSRIMLRVVVRQVEQCSVCLSQHTTYLVGDLLPNAEYCFRVSAINRHGFSDPGPPSDVIVTLDKLQALNLGQLAVSSVNETAFQSSFIFDLDLDNLRM